MTALPFHQALLKRATVDLVRACAGGAEAAKACRVRQQDLSDYGNRDQPARFMPADVIRDLEAVAGRPIVTEVLAREQGFELYRLPDAAMAPTDWNTLLAAQIREGGDVMQAVALNAPGGITRREIIDSNLIGEIDQAIAVLVTMRHAACAIVNGE